jgi:hypothetical protein
MGLAVSCCQPRAEPERCVELVEHYTELLARSLDPEVKASTLATLRAQAQLNARRHAEVRECGARLSAREVECALAAEHVDAAERCLLTRPY